MFKYRQYIDILSDSLKAIIAQMTKIAIGNIHIEEIEKLKELYPIAHSMEYIDNNPTTIIIYLPDHSFFFSDTKLWLYDFAIEST